MALICDQGTNNRRFLQILEKVSIEKPYIVYNNKRVFVIYDPPHLLKNVWNNFMKSNYKYGDVEVRWQYFVDFYNRDKTMSIRMAPKLTDRHIILPPFSAMRVNLAAQTFSHSVAAGINTLCTLNYLPNDASVTAEFIETFDQLFNTFNSASRKSSHKYKHAFRDNSGHIPFLNSCLRFLSKVKTMENAIVPCLIGWEISIKSLLALWENLQRTGFKYFLTNRLNQDCVENLFSIIRGSGGHRDNPNCEQFWASFQHIIVDKLFVHSPSANCVFDPDKILLDISSFSIHQKKIKNVSTPQNIASTQLLKLAIPAPSLEKKNVVAYMAGYLIRRHPINNCDECRETLLYDTLPEPSPVSEYELIRSKTYKDSGALIYPSTIFSHFVQNLEDLFCALFGGIMYEKDVLKKLCEHGCGEIPQLIKCGNVHCTIRLHEYVKLYMTIRIHHAIKISNICMSSGHKRNRKMLKLCHEWDDFKQSL